MNKFLIAGIGLLLLGIGTAMYVMSADTVNTTLSDNQVSQPVIPACDHQPLKEQTEGPYYKEGSPQTTEFYKASIPGEKVTLSGFVLDTECKPIANAWIDFWQANGNGDYDNSGYSLRGHQYTDASGKFILTTVIPGEYPGRTPHIHFKVRAEDSAQVVTSQLYLPDKPKNESDAIFDQGLVMEVTRGKDGTFATYNIILNR